MDKSDQDNTIQRTQAQAKEKRYGYFRLKPSWIQCCNNPNGFLIAYCLFAIASGTISGGILNINVSALERRFRLSSSESAIIVVGYDIGFCLLTTFLPYFGARSHRPRIVAAGAAVFGLGCLLYVLPHFITGLYFIGDSILSVPCNPAFSPDCSSEENLYYNFPIFVLSTLLMGFGLCPLFTLGLAYLEDSVSKDSASLYLGIANAAGLVGPTIGFLGGGVLLKDYYVDFDKITTNINFLDPRWVGAWWVIPMVMMACCWLLVIPLFGFPKQIPGTARNRAQRVSEVHKRGGADTVVRHGFCNLVKDFPRALGTLLKNPTFLLASIAGCLQALIINGVSAFMTKYLENNFHESLGDAALLLGSVIVPAGIAGNLVGGIVIYVFKWRTVGMLRFAGLCMLGSGLLAPQFLLYCENRPVSGITYSYRTNPSGPARNLTALCNANCFCQEEFYVASCSSEDIEYFSPCHAGCIGVRNNTLPFIFEPCFCTDTNVSLTIGRCPSLCTGKSPALALAFLSVFLTFASFTPALLASFRVVPESMRSFAVGVQFIFFRLLGTIPGPILYGTFIDRTCILWQTRQCDKSRGSCWIYQSRDMAISFLIITAVGNILSAVVYALAAVAYKPGSDSSKQENNSKEERDENGKDLPISSSHNKAYVDDID